jgi:DNA-binding MarR family transcriptional regulator
LINELVDAGLLVRNNPAEDRRAFALSLSTAGEAMHRDCLAMIGA